MYLWIIFKRAENIHDMQNKRFAMIFGGWRGESETNL